MSIIGKIATIFSFKDASGNPLAWRGESVTIYNARIINDTAYIAPTAYVDCRPGNKIAVELTAVFSGAPTSFEVVALFRRKGQTAWQEYRMGEWNFLTYSKAEIDAITAPVADTLRELLTVEAVGDEISFALRGTGTAVGATFTVTIVATPVKI